MPVYLEHACAMSWPSRHNHDLSTINIRERKLEDQCLHIGLVNNMPDKALEATERQFTKLLQSASENISIRLSLFTLPEIARSRSATSYLSQNYCPFTRDSSLDALIVTGAEPCAPDLQDEPYWDALREVMVWAKTNTNSTIWSCLAAHAAILNFDGIARIRSSSKFFGLLKCSRTEEHPLVHGLPPDFRVPHSRWNGVSEQQLSSCGYQVLTRTADAGVDVFMKPQGRSLFVFMQGHPEYETDTLLREYRRDIARYARGESTSMMSPPRDYFDAESSSSLIRLQQLSDSMAKAQVETEALSILATARQTGSWQSTAVCLYRNWLQYLRLCKVSKVASLSNHNHLEARADGETSQIYGISESDRPVLSLNQL